MDGKAKADSPVWVEESRIFRDIVENASWTIVNAEDGCFEVYCSPKVVVAGEFVWIDKYVGRERVESMKGTRSRERREREAREEGRMKTR